MARHEATATGDEAFAFGALAAGVGLVTGYPGSPSSGTVEALLEMPEAAEVQIAWAINECIAIEMAFGASLAGRRALLCVKSVGLNIALDPLMTMVLTGCNAGFVILLGDDPGGWASQNEQDSRPLAVLADIPLLEPASAQEAQEAMVTAFDLSERYNLPVIVRETRALALGSGPVRRRPASTPRALPYRREPMRWISLPVNVVENHRRLHTKLASIQNEFETLWLNRTEGKGELGLVACGAAYGKLTQALGPVLLSQFHVLKLGTFQPLPEQTVERFLKRVGKALVVEENEPHMEQVLSALAHRRGLDVTLLGRGTGHFPIGGELTLPEIVSAVSRMAPHVAADLPTTRVSPRPMPSKNPLCPDCPYIPLFETLLDHIEVLGGRDHTIIVGDPGCMVRACQEPFDLLDVKYSLGASVGLAVGLAMARPPHKVIALSGDSAFLHHGWGGLVEAARNKVDLLVIVLDNGTTALSGGQPHAGTAHDTRGRPTAPVDIARVALAAGAEHTHVIDPLDRAATGHAIRAAFARSGLNVLIARSPCPRTPALLETHLRTHTPDNTPNAPEH